jgi:hypothetical protein
MANAKILIIRKKPCRGDGLLQVNKDAVRQGYFDPPDGSLAGSGSQRRIVNSSSEISLIPEFCTVTSVALCALVNRTVIKGPEILGVANSASLIVQLYKR